VKRTTIWYDPERDGEALRAVRERWGLDSDSAAWRFALRLVAQAKGLEIVKSENSTETEEVQDEHKR
jgi:hypothetical protein